MPGRTRALLLALASASSLTGQHVELSGSVVDLDGSPVAGAVIGFQPLPLPTRHLPGVRGNYGAAQRIQLENARLPKTATDRDGEWRVSLSAAQAALTTCGLSRFVMTVRSPRHASWQRCLAGDLRDAANEPARLPPRPERPPLRLSFEGGGEPWQGCVLVERAFRIERTRAIWVREVVLIERDGSCAFEQRVRIPGEPPATRPSAREEAYRVTVYAAGHEALQRMIAPGAHTIELAASPWRPRKILAERAAPPKPPFEASYEIGGEQITLSLREPVVPLLGDVEPVRVTTGSGEVELDPWDPDVPLFVARSEGGATTAADTGQEEKPRDSGALELSVTGADGRAVYGAGAWIETRAVKRCGPGADVFAVTDSQGRARLERLPLGTFSVLVQHPERGFAEILADVTRHGGRASIALTPHSVTQDAAPELTGTILLDLGAGDAADSTAVGIFGSGPVVWRTFDARPRLVRLEGLVPGPTSFFVRIGDHAPCFAGGLLTGDFDDPALEPLAYAEKTFTIRASDDSGAPLAEIDLSLGEPPGRDGVPRSKRLFIVEPRGDGVFEVRLRLEGNLWVRVHADGHEPTDLQLASSATGEPVDVALARIPPPPPPEGDRDKAPAHR